MPCIAYLALPVVARFLCGGRKGTVAYVVGLLSIAALGLGSLGLAAFLFHTGQKAHWQSEGPGILFLILVMLAFAAAAVVFGAMFVGALSRGDSDEEDKFATLRAVLAGLVVLTVVVTAARLLWLLR